MADFELLAPGGHQKLVDEVVDRLDLKADIDGYYAQLTAGAADNLTGRGDATAAEFLYRTAGGTADIETGQAVAKSVKGNTLVWNQIVSEADAHKSGTAASGAWLYTSNFVMTSGHKYLLIRSGAYADFGNTCRVVSTTGTTIVYSGTPNIPNKQGVIFDCTETRDTYFVQAWIVSGEDYDFYLNLFDLTAMFGAGNEPSTVAEFEALFPLPYYEYDAGSLLSVNIEGIETTGFNQWDGTFKSGNQHFDYTTGEFNSAGGWVCTDKIPAFPDTVYYLRADIASGSTSNIVVGCWDAGDNYLGHIRYGTWNSMTSAANPNTAYIRAEWTRTSSVTNICINLSWSGRRNGEYESYWSAQREIAAATYFPDGMRSAGTVRDELTSTEAIVRVGEVDLGTLTWTAASSDNIFYASPTNMATPSTGQEHLDGIVCSKYAIDTVPDIGDAMTDGTMKRYNGRVYIKDVSYSDASAFKTAMSGIMLHYALATPTVTPIDPPLNLSYRVDDFGTERVMVPEDERSAPPVLDIAYGLNVVDFVRRAPSEYISAASFRQYLLARDAHDGTTTTMTWDDTDNRYEFAITDVETEG